MSADLERAVRSYAEYLDEVLPTVTADEVSSAPGPAAVERPGALHRRHPWYRRPAVVFLAAMVAVLLIALLPVVFLGARSADVVEPPATTAPEPDAAPSVTTTLLTDTSDPSVIRLAPVPDTDPVVVSTPLGDFEFVTMPLPADPEFLPSGLAGTVNGAAAVVDETLWWSTDYDTWYATPIGHDSVRVSIAGGDAVVVSGRASATRFVWDGDEWSRRTTVEIPGLVDKIVFGPQGAVAMSGDAIYHSTDGVTFTEASRGPDLGVFWSAVDVPEEDRDFGDCRATFDASIGRHVDVLATETGFAVLTAAEHPGEDVCAPFLWFSVDGDAWDLVGSESPFGQVSIVDAGDSWRPIAARDGRFVATGGIDGMGVGEPDDGIWVSDDALAWRRVEVEGLGGVVSAGAGEIGWLLIDFVESEGLRMWLSADADTWDGPYVLPGGLSIGYVIPQFAVTDDAIVAVDLAEQIIAVGRLQNETGE